MKVPERGGEVREQGGCIYLMITFLLVAAPETPGTRSTSSKTEIINKQKMLEEAGDESGQRAGARRALRMRRCEVSIIH